MEDKPKQRAKLGIAIFDIDGCISDDRPRLNLIAENLTGNAKYALYHSKAGMDVPLELGADILRKFIKNNTLIAFVTSRPVSLQAITSNWIWDNFGLKREDGFMLAMRPIGNTQTSPELKLHLASEVVKFANEHGSQVIAAFDDRQDVIDVYRGMGINAYKLNAYETDAPEIRVHTEEELDLMCAPIEGPAEVEAEPAKADSKQLPADGCGSVFFPEGRTTGVALRGAADLFDSRNSHYRDNAYIVGQVMAALFPEGVTVKSADDHHMYHLTELMVVKLTRFATSGLKHSDSIRDLIAYAGMVETRHEKHSIEVH